MTDRREFLLQGANALGVAPMLALAKLVQLEDRPHDQAVSLDQIARDERFWANIRGAYTLNERVVNLDNGWTNPAPAAAVDELVRGARALEALPAEELGRIFFSIKNPKLRPALAETLGVDAAEIAIVRNATEALNTVLLGVPLRAGDEIVCSAHDYFAMLDALEQRQARDGVRLRMVRPPVPAPSFDALAEMYEAAIGSRTKLVLLTHPSNLTGQLLPVRRIAAAAHRVVSVRKSSSMARNRTGPSMIPSRPSTVTTMGRALTSGWEHPWAWAFSGCGRPTCERSGRSCLLRAMSQAWSASSG